MPWKPGPCIPCLRGRHAASSLTSSSAFLPASPGPQGLRCLPAQVMSDESRGTEGTHKQHQTERRNACYSDTLCFNTISEIGIPVTHSPGARPAHGINKYANKAWMAVLRAMARRQWRERRRESSPLFLLFKDFNLIERFSITSLYFHGTPATRHTPFIHPLCFSSGQQPQPSAHSTFWALKEGYFRH